MGGVARAVAQNLDTHTRARAAHTHILAIPCPSNAAQIVEDNFDLRPGCIIRDLQLKRPVYQKTASYGHFGRTDAPATFTWEQAKELKY